MTQAENNRISHRQLYRQICLAFTGPFLLCIFGRERLSGTAGIAGTLAAAALLSFYVIFLIRLTPHYEELEKRNNRMTAWVIGLCFLSYILLTAAFLLSVLDEVVPVSMLEGVSGRWITLAAVLTCSLGTGKGMQKRGRMAEVSAVILLGSVLLMMLLSLGQARPDFFLEPGVSTMTTAAFSRSMYLYLCAFSGIGLLPFLLGEVEKQGSSWKPILSGILTVTTVVLGMLLLLPAVFGRKRLMQEAYPILPLLAGANLPGNILARFDVLWMGFVLYGIFFSLGSLFHYGNRVLRMMIPERTERNRRFLMEDETKEEKTKEEKTILSYNRDRWWMPLLMGLLAWSLSFWQPGGYEISAYYLSFLGYIFVPLLLLIQCVMLIRPVHRGRMARVAAVLCIFGLTGILVGCAGIDPEKRLFPLAAGVDRAGDDLQLSYGIPDLPQATGQGRPEEETSAYLSFTGKTFSEIKQAYNRSQEKYLDLGHLQVLLLGQKIVEREDWDLIIDFLKQEPMVGENVYVFYTETPSDILDWQGSSGTSVGEYLVGILENRTDGSGTPGVTLRQVYQQFYKDGTLPALPQVRRSGDTLEIEEL